MRYEVGQRVKVRQNIYHADKGDLGVIIGGYYTNHSSNIYNIKMDDGREITLLASDVELITDFIVGEKYHFYWKKEDEGKQMYERIYLGTVDGKHMYVKRGYEDKFHDKKYSPKGMSVGFAPYMKKVEEVEVTMEEVAKALSIPVEYLRIKK